MPNAEHVALLAAGRAAWKAERPDLPDLTDADLSKRDLRGFDLTRARLAGALLSSSRLDRASLCWADLAGAVLNNTSLRGADLQAADLQLASLVGARLRSANLLRANFGEAVLVNASLAGADAAGADFDSANLTNTSLWATCLLGANLAGALVDRADFNAAEFGRTLLPNLDLHRAANLHLVRHSAPSSVGIDTLYKSEGRLPRNFLQGCGVPDILVQDLPNLLAPKGMDFYSAFISYSHADRKFASRLYNSLFNDHGIRCWLDEHQLLPGDDIMAAINSGIKEADKLLLICSASSLSNPVWVDREAMRAFEKEEQLTKRAGRPVKVLIPIDLDGFLHSSECDYRYSSDLRGRLAADFSQWEADADVYSYQMTRVVRALRTDALARPVLPAPKLI